jgi:hypothetical protein
MHRVDGEGNLSGLFTEGDPASGLPATAVTAKWLNAIQEELIGVITPAGITLNPSNNGQLEAALTYRFGRLATSNTWNQTQSFSYINVAGTAQISLAQCGTVKANVLVAEQIQEFPGEYRYSPAVERYAYVDASEFAVDANGRYSLTSSGSYVLSNNAAAAVCAARIRAPVGATIVGVEMLIANFDANTQRQLTDIRVMRVVDGATGVQSRTQINTGTTMNTGINQPPTWSQIALPVQSSFTVPTNGWLSMHFTLPASANLTVYALRMRYSQTVIAPS